MSSSRFLISFHVLSWLNIKGNFQFTLFNVVCETQWLRQVIKFFFFLFDLFQHSPKNFYHLRKISFGFTIFFHHSFDWYLITKRSQRFFSAASASMSNSQTFYRHKSKGKRRGKQTFSHIENSAEEIWSIWEWKHSNRNSLNRKIKYLK